jgi:outer membrane lipopolysaccharide assembly protein LptE/RlpB
MIRRPTTGHVTNTAHVNAGNVPANSGKRDRSQGKERPFSFALAILLSILLLCTACGYHTAGHNVSLPSNVQTISIPAFVNQTQTYKIEQKLTAAVVREMVTRTHYHILNDPSDSADATLRGTVISTSTSPLTYDSQNGRASSALVVVTARVTLTDRQGKILYENPSYLFREEYQVSQELSSFFEEDSPALERLSREFARTLVSNVLEGF